jgi:hypothetical protein
MDQSNDSLEVTPHNDQVFERVLQMAVTNHITQLAHHMSGYHVVLTHL